MNQWLFLGAEAVRGQVPAVARQVEEIVPGARQAAEAWLPGKSAAKGDVPGEDLADIPRTRASCAHATRRRGNAA